MANKSKVTKTKFRRDAELLYEIGCLRNMQRTWQQFNNPDAANIAEHIYRVMWIASMLARYEKANEEKVLKIAMAHDIAESRTGDVNYISRQYTERREMEAFKDMMAGTVFEAELIKLLEEYEECATLEAKIVKDADNLDVELELAEFRAKGNLLGAVLAGRRDKVVYPKLRTKTAKEFWQAIKKVDPHDWHHLSPQNRFNAGDWKGKR